MTEGQHLEITLYELYEDDRARVFDLVELLGVPSTPTRAEAETLDEDGMVSAAALVCLAGYLRLVRSGERLDAFLAELVGAGWEIDAAPGLAAVRLRSPPVADAAAAWDRVMDAARPLCLWAVTGPLGRQLLGGADRHGVTDLHRRPDGVSARDGALDSISSTALVARLRTSGRGASLPLLDVLPDLRARLCVAMDLALGLRADQVVAALCAEDPEAAEVGGPDHAPSRTRAINSHRSVLSRSRERIEDALIAGDPRLGPFVEQARTTPLPPATAATIAAWRRETRPSDRAVRRARAVARLGWLTGSDPAGVTLSKHLAGDLSEEEAWDLVAACDIDAPAPFAALEEAGDSVAITLFLLRYCTWSRGQERPGLETLGERFLPGPPGREAAVRSARVLEAARRRITRALRDADAAGPTQTAGGPETSPDAASSDELPSHAAAFQGEGLWPATWWAPTDRSHQALRDEVREAVQRQERGRSTIDAAARDVSRLLAGLRAGIEAGLARLRWWVPDGGFPLGFALDGALSPPVVEEGDLIELSVPADAAPAGWRVVLVEEVGGRTRLVHPRPDERWLRLADLELRADHRWLPITVDGASGPRRYVLGLLPADADPPTSASLDAVREAFEDGTAPAAAVGVVVG